MEDNTTNTRETFVYDNVEVIKTGRVATKALPSGKINQLIEITPANKMFGAWIKWVKESDLFTINV